MNFGRLRPMRMATLPPEEIKAQAREDAEALVIAMRGGGRGARLKPSKKDMKELACRIENDLMAGTHDRARRR